MLPPVQPAAGHRHRPQGGPAQPRHRGRGARRPEDDALAQGDSREIQVSRLDIILIQVNIELIMIEVNHSNQGEIERTLRSAGYQVYKKLKNQDVIYKKIRPALYRSLN